MLRVLRGCSGEWSVINQASMGLELSKKLTFLYSYLVFWNKWSCSFQGLFYLCNRILARSQIQVVYCALHLKIWRFAIGGWTELKLNIQIILPDLQQGHESGSKWCFSTLELPKPISKLAFFKPVGGLNFFCKLFSAVHTCIAFITSKIIL